MSRQAQPANEIDTKVVEQAAPEQPKLLDLPLEESDEHKVTGGDGIFLACCNGKHIHQ